MYINKLLPLQGTDLENSVSNISAWYLYYHFAISIRANPHINPRCKDIVLFSVGDWDGQHLQPCMSKKSQELDSRAP